jgi:hypothetical protein
MGSDERTIGAGPAGGTVIIEEALEKEASEALGRGYYEHGAWTGRGYRNGYRTGRLKTAEGAIECGMPQIADRLAGWRGCCATRSVET